MKAVRIVRISSLQCFVRKVTIGFKIQNIEKNGRSDYICPDLTFRWQKGSIIHPSRFLSLHVSMIETRNATLTVWPPLFPFPPFLQMRNLLLPSLLLILSNERAVIRVAFVPSCTLTYSAIVHFDLRIVTTARTIWSLCFGPDAKKFNAGYAALCKTSVTLTVRNAWVLKKTLYAEMIVAIATPRGDSKRAKIILSAWNGTLGNALRALYFLCF